MRTLPRLAAGLSALLLTGCVDFSLRITPENLLVNSMTEGRDCTYVVFGFGTGTNTVEQAMANATPPIQNIRSISLTVFHFLVFESHCLKVVGESAPAGEGAR